MKKLALSAAILFCVASLILVACKDDEPRPTTSTSSNTGTFTDTRDNKTYKTVTIEGQTWFAENLNYGGTLSAGSTSCLNNSQDSCNKYGRRYTWDAANVACPLGWHLPTDAEWQLLEHNVGMTDADTAKYGSGTNGRGYNQAIGIKLQKGGSTGFNVVLQPFAANLSQTFYWTSTPSPTSSKYWDRVFVSDSLVYRVETGGGASLCIRCLKNQ